MSASSSSRIDPAIGHLAALGQSLVDERSDVLSVLGQVADPRKRRGVRHLSLIHISEPTRLLSISYAVFCFETPEHLVCRLLLQKSKAYRMPTSAWNKIQK